MDDNDNRITPLIKYIIGLIRKSSPCKPGFQNGRAVKCGYTSPLSFSDGDLDGLSEIIFSSFNKMLACLTHFFNETNTRKNFEVIADFYTIDPNGAGSTGRSYWESWIAMGRANFEEFGY